MTIPTYEQAQTILRCPITKQPLRLLEQQEVALLNQKIASGELLFNDGSPIKVSLEAGFISMNELYAYAVLDGIILLMENLAIPSRGSNEAARVLGTEKKVLQDFYDMTGWQKAEQGAAGFNDALKWEDLRPVSREYIHDCHLRVNRYIRHEGRYLLDAGSGPIQYPEYLSYSEGFDFRVCVDLSFQALKEAQRKLGDKGIYILGDITNIPIQDNIVDGAVSLHVIYHIPEDEQITAFREIQRVLTPGSSAAIVYSWPKPQMMARLLFPRRIKRKVQRRIRKMKSLVKKIIHLENQRKSISPSSVPLAPYHFTHDQAYFTNTLKGMDYKILVWRSVSVPFMRMYIHPHLFGEAILRWIYQKEEHDPVQYGRIGQYPLFVVQK